jgi:TPR repeat protein
VLLDGARALALHLRAAAEPPGYTFEDAFIPNLGVAEAENGLGCMHRDGDAVAVDGAAARAYFLRGARHGSVHAMNSLACCFRCGTGGGVDLAQARVWFERACVLELPTAMFNLGVMLVSGEDGERDVSRGRRLLEKAASRGHSLSGDALAQLTAAEAAAAGSPRPSAVFPPEFAAVMKSLSAAMARGPPRLGSSSDYSMPWNEAMEVVLRRAEAGCVASLRYRDGFMALAAAEEHAEAARHDDAVRLLARAYDRTEGSLPLSGPGPLSASVQAVLAADADHADARVCWFRGMPKGPSSPSASAATALLRRAVAAHPRHAALQELYGSVLCFSEDWAGAAGHFSRALELNPGYFAALYGRAVCFSKQMRLAEAKAGLQEFVRAAPRATRKLPEALYQLAFLEIMEGSRASAAGGPVIFSAYDASLDFYLRALEAERDKLPVFPVVSVPEKDLSKTTLAAIAASPLRAPRTAAAPTPGAAPRASAGGQPCARCTQGGASLTCAACASARYCSRLCHWVAAPSHEEERGRR